MDVMVFSAKSYDRRFLETANTALRRPHKLIFQEIGLNAETAVLAHGATAVCAFVNDVIDAHALERLAAAEIHLVVLRSAGFNNVDLAAARRLGIKIARVPGYSPEAIAEHTVAMIMSLNRHIHRAHARVRGGNFSLEGLLGFDMHRARSVSSGSARSTRSRLRRCSVGSCSSTPVAEPLSRLRR